MRLALTPRRLPICPFHMRRVDRSFIPKHLGWQLMDASVCTGIRSRNFPVQSRNYDFSEEWLRNTFEGDRPR